MQIFDGRQYFWQWDLNQKLTSDDLQIGEEVHFYNTKQPKAVRAIAYEQDGVTVVDVPNILLQYSIPLMVYRTVDGDFEAFSTIKEYEFEVKQRAKPNNYVVNETEILDYRTLEKKVENLEKTMVTPSWDNLEDKPFGEIDGKTVPIDEKYIPDSIARTAEIQTEISDALADAKVSGEFKGDKGDPFTYEDFTSEQLEDLKGEPFTYEDFTPEQLEKLKGEPGIIVTGASVGQYIKVKAVDENGKPTEWEAVDLEIPEAPQADWSQNDENAADYVKNRTHWDGRYKIKKVIEWDGNTEGLVVASGSPYYKVSGVILDDNTLKTGIVHLSTGESVVIADLWDDDENSSVYKSDEAVGIGGIVAVRTAGATLDTVTFPETGLYFMGVGTIYVSRFEYIGIEGELHKLSNDFIDAEWMATVDKNGREELYPETTLDVGSANVGGSTLSTNIPFVLGEEYIVTWDGEEYACKADALTYASYDFIGVGDASLLGGAGNGEPFAIATSSALGTLVMASDGVAGTHTFKVEKIVEKVNKLPNKFLDLDWIPQMRQEQFEGTLLSETTLHASPNVGGGMNYGAIPEEKYMKEGDTVKVVWDGVEYERLIRYTTFTFGDAPFELLYAGNAAAFYEVGVNEPDTKEPFMISFGVTDHETGEFAHSLSVYVATEDALNVDHTVSVIAEWSVNKLPEKYLPDTVAKKEDVFSGSWTDLTDRPFSVEGTKQILTDNVTMENGQAELDWIPEIGQTYTVVLNGTTYLCPCVDNGEGYPTCVPEGTDLTDESNPPAVIIVHVPAMGTVAANYLTTGTDVISIYLDSKTTTFNPDQMPEGYPYKVVKEVSGDTLTWDGNTEGLISVNVGEATAYRISDAVPTLEDCTNGASAQFANGDTENSTYEDLVQFSQDAGILTPAEGVLVIPEDNYNYMGVITFPKSGIYFSAYEEGRTLTSLTIPGYTGFVTKEEVIVPLSPDFAPEIPFFDLVEMGLPTVVLGGEKVIFAGDFSEIMTAAAKGNIKLRIAINTGTSIVTVITNGTLQFVEQAGFYSTTMLTNLSGSVYGVVNLIVAANEIQIKCETLILS